MAAIVRMTALSVFANTQIANAKPTAPRRDTVETGDPFEAPWHVARDLSLAGLAKADDPAALDEEPTEDLAPHPTLSRADLARANERRAARAGRAARPATPGAVTGAAVQRAPALPGSIATGATGTADGAMGASGSTGTVDGTTGAGVSIAKSNVPPIPPAPGNTGA